MYTGNKMTQFYGNILSLSENIAKSFRGLLFWLALYNECIYDHSFNKTKNAKTVQRL